MKKHTTLLEWRGCIYLEDNMEIRVLCSRCKNDYEDAGYSLFYIEGQEYGQSCDICGRNGYEYGVVKNGEE